MKKTMKVSDYLKQGREKAIPAKYLTAMMGLKSTRHLRLAVEAERRSGTVILSTQDPVHGGYFLPLTEDEIDVYIQEMESRCRTTYQLLRSAKRFKRLHMSGQMYMVDCSSGGNENGTTGNNDLL